MGDHHFPLAPPPPDRPPPNPLEEPEDPDDPDDREDRVKAAHQPESEADARGFAGCGVGDGVTGTLSGCGDGFGENSPATNMTTANAMSPVHVRSPRRLATSPAPPANSRPTIAVWPS